jgi:hypothetical protein
MSTISPARRRWKKRLARLGAVILFVIGVALLWSGIHQRTADLPLTSIPLRLAEVTFSPANQDDLTLDGDILDAVDSVVISRAPSVKISPTQAQPKAGDGKSQLATDLLQEAKTVDGNGTLSRHVGDTDNLIESLIFSGSCAVDASLTWIHVSPGCSAGQIVTSRTSPTRWIDKDGEQPLARQSKVGWKSPAEVTLRLMHERTAWRKVLEKRTALASLRGEVTDEVTFRESWWTSCRIHAHQTIDLKTSDGASIRAGLRFAPDGQSLVARLAPGPMNKTVCPDESCESSANPCTVDSDLFSLIRQLVEPFLALVLFALSVLLWRQSPRNENTASLKANGGVCCLLFVVLVWAASCASPAPRAGASLVEGRLPTTALAPDANPAVFALAAGMPCPRRFQHDTAGDGTARLDGSIADIANEEIARFSTAGIGVERLSPNPGLVQELERAAGSGVLRGGLILYYTGHATLAQEARQSVASTSMDEPETQLCLQGETTLAVRELLRRLDRLPRDNLPWVVIALDACESAYVRLDEFTLPTAVLSSSPELVTVSSADGPFLRGVVAALAHPADHDLNRDGMVSDSELLDSIESEIARQDGSRQIGAPRPRLQRQAPSSLPVRFHDDFGKERGEIAESAARLAQSESPTHQALAQALFSQLNLRRQPKLPRLDWDLVVSKAALPMAPCSAGGVSEVGPPSCLEGRPDLRRLDDGFANMAPAIAHFATFVDVYRLEIVEGRDRWYDVVRLRDGRLMAVTRTALLATIPRRYSVLARTANDSDWLVRATRIVSPITNQCEGHTPESCEIMSRHRRFTVCEEREGQCFVSSK